MPIYFLLALFTIQITNDILRNVVIKKNNKLYYFSLVLSIIGAAWLKYYIYDFITNIYMFFNIIEILNIRGRSKQLFMFFHFILYLGVVIFNTKMLITADMVTTIGNGLIIYLSILCMLYLSNAVRKEREETKKLNEELKSTNIKLQEYSLKIEELTIAKERQRVAQELHDSLGHSLMALTMHLEFAEKIFDKNPEKAKEVILKAENISKDSTANLRRAVNTLKEERNVEDLQNNINELIDSFKMLGNINISLSMDKRLEKLNPDIKLCIYKTIRESLTNGIKHGKATAFKLGIEMNTNYVELDIQDNGVGCDAMVRSNGLTGMENRIFALGGTVNLISSKNNGFLIKAKIPTYEEVNHCD
jgi:signal transduction histidine kinase